MKNTIEINGEKYVIKNTIRALFIFENITQKPFKIETLLDNYIFFYSLILASNKDKILKWDDYLDALDKDPTLFKKISDIVNVDEASKKIFDNGDDGGEQKKS